MKKIIRLTESDLMRLVRRVINEQTLPSTFSTIGTVIGNTNRLNALLNPTTNQSNPVYRLPQIKNEDMLDSFTKPSEDRNNPIISPGNFKYPKSFLKEVFGEKSENFNSSLSNLKSVSKQIFSVVAVLLALNAVTGETTPITLEKAKNLFKRNEDLRRIKNVGYNPGLDVVSEFYNSVDFLVKNKLDSDVFKYYSKLLYIKIN